MWSFQKSFFKVFMRRVLGILDGVLCISGGCCAYEKCSRGSLESIGTDESSTRCVSDILRQENDIFIDFSKMIPRWASKEPVHFEFYCEGITEGVIRNPIRLFSTMWDWKCFLLVMRNPKKLSTANYLPSFTSDFGFVFRQKNFLKNQNSPANFNFFAFFQRTKI